MFNKLVPPRTTRHSMFNKLVPNDISPEDFWSFAPAAQVGDPNICWEWQGPYWNGNQGNYGQYGYYPAHRVAYFIDTGQQPGKLEVCHHCDNPRCVNPAHLFLGSHSDNIKDCISKGRHRWGVNRPNGQAPDTKRNKLTQDDVRAIRNSTEPVPTLMKRYRLTESWVYQIKSRKAWKHVV